MLDKLLFKYIGNAKKYMTVSVILMMVKVWGTFFIAFSLGRIIHGLFSSGYPDLGTNTLIFL